MKNPTPKQVRRATKSFLYLYQKLNNSLWRAREQRIVLYDAEQNKEKSPTIALNEVRERFMDTTERARANALLAEIKEDLK